MATIAFEYQEGNLKGLEEFIEEVKGRLFNDNLLTNPYRGNVYKLPKEQRNIYLLTFTPIYPLMLFIIPTMIMAGLILFLNWNPFLFIIPTFFLSLILFFYSNSFFYLFFKIGLKKAKIDVKLKRVYTTELITLLVEKNGKNN